jgi:hypothetical protein
MINTKQLLEDTLENFEGGMSRSFNENTAIKKAVQSALMRARPDTLKRTEPLLGGSPAQGLLHFPCPSDYLAPVAIYDTHFNEKGFERPGIKYFDSDRFQKFPMENTFTVDTVNGVRSVIIRSRKFNDYKSKYLDKGDVLTGFDIEVNRSLMSTIIGGTSYAFKISPSQNSITKVFTTPVTSAKYATLKLYIPLAKYFNNINFQLNEGMDSVFYGTSTQELRSGWNVITFELPDETFEIFNYKIIFNFNLTISQHVNLQPETINLDAITVQEPKVLYFEYYSKNAFYDSSTGENYLETPSDLSVTYVNAPAEYEEILLNELALKILRATSFDRVDGDSSVDFRLNLQSAYHNYFLLHPSQEQQIIENHNTISNGVFGGADYGDIFRRGGEFDGMLGFYKTQFNNIDPASNTPIWNENFNPNQQLQRLMLQIQATGPIDGSNTVYTLAHIPPDYSTYQVVLNSGVYTQGDPLFGFTVNRPEGKLIFQNPLPAELNGSIIMVNCFNQY